MTEDTAQALKALSAKLTAPEDREAYARLISYFQMLPQNDEMFRMAEMLGLLCLLGKQIPDAAAELLSEMRLLAKTTADHHAQLDQNLAGLPKQISDGVDLGEIARTMSEAFRQQLSDTGLGETASLLKLSTAEISAKSGQISAALKSLGLEYSDVLSGISAELENLKTASRGLQEHNSFVMARERSSARPWHGLLALTLFLVGGLAGIFLEKHQTTLLLSGTYTQHERVQESACVTTPSKSPSLRSKRGKTP